MSAIKLRPYQREAIDAVFKAWADGMRRPAIVLPTGAGKTVVFSALVNDFRANQLTSEVHGNGGRRVMVLAHRDELVDQAIAKIRATLPDGVSVGKVKAESDEITADVMVCSVQTLASMRRLNHLKFYEHQTGEHVGLIITDECHHAAAASYGRIYDAFPDALQLGVTATMARGDGVGLGKVWGDVVYSRSILWMISKGYLTDVRTRQVDLKALDMADVKASRGDWQAGDLGRAMMDAQADTAIARAYKEHAGSRQGIVFTPTVETAHAATLALGNSGIRAEIVHGETHPDNRRILYEGFRTGKIQVLVNCMVLTEGFDAPWAEVAVIARPTQSAPLYTQMVGRVLRPWPGKSEALVLDIVGAAAHKLRTLVDLDPGTVKQVRDGETLAEATMREAEEGDRIVKGGSLAFDLKFREVNSFGASDYAWGRTRAGVMYIQCGEHYVALWPTYGQPGLWDVWAVPRSRYERGIETPYKALDIGSAMAWGEAVAEDYATSFGVSKSAAWRRKPVGPTQRALAERLGVAVGPKDRAGDVSERIDWVLASSRLDRNADKA